MRKRVHSAGIKGISIAQIYLLVIATVAFAFALGQTIPSVEALGEPLPAYLQNVDPGATVVPTTSMPTGAAAGAKAAAASTTYGGAGTATKIGFGPLSTTTYSYSLGHLYTGFVWGAVVAGVVKLVASMFGADASTSNALSIAAGAGVLAYNLALAGFGAAAPGAVAAAGTLTSAAGAATAADAAALISAASTGATATVSSAAAGAAATAAAAPGATAASVAGAATAQTAGVTLSTTTGVASPASGAFGSFLSAGAAFAIAAVVVLVVFAVLYKKVKQEIVTFECLPWEPALGGAKCEQCNADPLRPCSEYRCKSLGQACELLNKDSATPQCAWVSRSDTQSPTIREWQEVLRPTDLRYTPNNALRPGARGVKIVSSTADSCLPAFTNLRFGVLTNEPAQCKIDFNRSVAFDDMQFYMGGSNYYEYNHSQIMKLPNPSDPDFDLSPIMQNDGTFSMFIRCRDANGNTNVDEYSINYCVAAGPDTTPPVVVGSSLEDGTPVQSGVDTAPIEVYVNEPAQCKWSTMDKSYADMENMLACVQEASQINANLQYTCIGALTGIENQQSRDFYFRCEDQPTKPVSERNVMTQSYKVTLRGTQPLTLLKAGPNSTTITSSASSVDVELYAQTDDGADEGKAICYYSPSGDLGSFIEFYETDAIDHKQQLSLVEGNYTYYMRCVDAGANLATTNVSFSVKVDKSVPTVTRVYKRGTDSLQIVTNEAAQCFYSRTSCNFVTQEGLALSNPSAEQQRVHIAAWKDNSPYFIKCRDPYGNEPSPNSCSIIVSGVDLSVQAVAG